MAIETFTYDPLTEPVGTKTFRVLEAKFGDGYAQTAADGINNSMQSWPLTFQGYAKEITPIKQFLDRHQGWKAFRWTPPLETETFFKAKSYSLSAGVGFNNYILSVTFEESFKPAPPEFVTSLDFSSTNNSGLIFVTQ